MTQTSQKPLSEKIKENAASAASDMSDAAANKARTEAETVRDTASDEARKTADAAQAAADEFDAGSLHAKALEEVARQVDHLADQIRTTDIDRVARSVGQAAERNPLMFVAGAALAGFAATRFLRARDPGHSTASRAGNIPRAGAPVDPAPGTVWRVGETPGRGV